MAEALLRVTGICKRFSGLLALDHASFLVERGSITALIGPNGAGKTTLFAIISGFLLPDAGRIVYAGTDITGARPHRLARRGIARTFQIVQPFGSLTVAENIAVGCHLSRPARTDALAAARELAQTVGLGDLVERRAADLTLAALKRLELARALAIEPRLLLLDEVLAGLNPAEIAEVLPLIRAIRGRGTTIILIEHVMQAVMSLADEVLVLAEGRIIMNGAPAAVASNPSVIEAYLGRGAAGRMPAAAQSNG
jgi:branched-chain amino acid transport system ATP-binding protein